MPVIFQSSHQDKKRRQSVKNAQSARTKPQIAHKQSLPRKTTTLGAYVMRPTRIHFATQAKNEQILLFLRKHPITQLPWVILAGIMVVFPILLVPLVSGTIGDVLTLPSSFTIVLILFWYLVTIAYVFVNFIMWYYNINIVSNQRVVDIDFLYLLVQEVTATRIAQIEDVTYKRSGSFATLFDYGNIFVQTAGAEVNIEFMSIPKPKQVSQIIIELMGQPTHRHIKS